MRIPNLLPFILLLPACSTTSGGQTGEEAAHCVRKVDAALADGEVSPLGFGRAEVMTTVDGPRNSSLRYADVRESPAGASQTPVHFTFTPSSDAAHYVEEEMDGSGGQELSLGCSTYVEVKGELTMLTADGTFDESWQIGLQGQVTDHTTAFVQLEWDALNGIFDFSTLVPDGEAAVTNGSASFSFFARETDNVSGEINGMSERQGPADTVGATSIPVGTIGNQQGAL